MKKLKVCMFMDGWYPDINGVVVVMDNLIKNMKDYADVTLVVPKNGHEEDDKNFPFKIIRVDSMPLFNTGYRLGLVDAEYLRLKRLFKKLDFDIVHIHSPFALGRLGLRVARSKNIPVVSTMHTRWEFELKKYLHSDTLTNLTVKHLIKTYNKCDDSIALNNALIKVYKDYGYTGSFTIIHNGTDLKEVKDKKTTIIRINNFLKLNENDRVLLFVGRINSVKNIFFIVDVLKKLSELNFDYKMIFVGDGPDYDNLKEKINEYNLNDRVIMTGKIMDRDLLKSIYYRSDLFIFPSLFDSSSLVQIEAASQGTPSLFVSGSVTSDTVEDNINGFKEIEDVDAFANKIINIFENKKLYSKVSKNAKRDLAPSWENIARETYKYYLNIIEKYKNSKR